MYSEDIGGLSQVPSGGGEDTSNVAQLEFMKGQDTLPPGGFGCRRLPGNLWGQVLEGNHWAVPPQDDHPLHNIAELAHIARPGMPGERFGRRVV